MFDKKKYYTSSLSLKNRYCVKKELPCQSAYERRMQTVDEYNEEYVILFERIGNYLPNGKNLMFELPIHESVVYPVDLIQKSNGVLCFLNLCRSISMHKFHQFLNRYKVIT